VWYRLAEYEKLDILTPTFYETFDEIVRVSNRIYKPISQPDLEVWLVKNWRTFNFEVDFLTDLSISFLRQTADSGHKDGRLIHEAIKSKADHACFDRLQELWTRFLKYHGDVNMMREGYYILYEINGIPSVYIPKVFTKQIDAMQHAVKELKLKSGFFTIQNYPDRIVPLGPDSSSILKEDLDD